MEVLQADNCPTMAQIQVWLVAVDTVNGRGGISEQRLGV